MLSHTIEMISDRLLAQLMRQRRLHEQAERSCKGILCSDCQKHPKQKIHLAISEQRPLILILPAFPAKSANREKTLSEKPDRGEIMGLENLNQLCKDMSAIYQPGVKLIICSGKADSRR